MDSTKPVSDLELDAFAEQLDDVSATALSTAGCFSTIGTFAGSCASSGSSFSTASS